MKKTFSLLALAALPLFQGCMNDSSKDDATNAEFAQTLFTAQEGNLVSIDLATGNALPGIITDVKAPTDMQALKDGTILVNLTGSSEILIVDGKTMVQKARLPSSPTTGRKPVHSFITPEYAGKQYWMSLNDSGATANTARFLDVDPASKTYLTGVGEATLGNGHHKAAFSPDRPRVVISNIADCADIMSVFDFSDIGNILKLSTLTEAGAGFDKSDAKHTCDQSKVAGISPSPHGCATAKGTAHALCNMTGNGVLVAVDLNAAVPGFKLIATDGTGGGYTAAHPAGRYVYTLQSAPKEGGTGSPCQIGQMAVVDMQTDSLVKELPLLYKGPDCKDSLAGTPAQGASGSHTLFSADGARAYINVGTSLAASSIADKQLVLDVSAPANPKQLASVTIGNSYGSHGETMTGDGKYLLVANNKDATVSQIDMATGTVVKTIPIGNAGKTMATFGSAEGPSHQTGPFH
ncbi:MAG: hypothetical protein JWP91_4093 [Fibrobacteres bacterium]|nr:hypothetical protein [Fibrobacterota bacterium]